MNLYGPISDDRRHLGRGAGQEALLEVGQLFRHDRALDHLVAALLGELDDRLARDAVEEAIRRRRMDDAVLDEEDVGAGRLGDLAAPVEHQRVGIALPLRLVLGDRADHVEAGRLRFDGAVAGIGPAVLGHVEADALQPLFRLEVGRPLPDRDGEVDLGLLRGRRPSSRCRARRSGGHRRRSAPAGPAARCRPC